MITVVGNLKGGSGKSTVAFNLAVWLTKHHRNVLSFDLDPQKTFTDVLEVRSDEGFEPEIIMAEMEDTLTESLQAAAAEAEVIVDVGTADMESLKTALEICDRVIVPVAPSQADVWSTQRFMSIINKTRQDKATKPDIVLFVNRADTHHSVRESDETEKALKMLPGGRVAPLRLHQRTAYRRAFSEGLAVFEMQPSSKSANEFLELAEFFYPDT